MADVPPIPLAALAPVRRSILAHFDTLPPPQAADGRQLLSRLAPERWAVEWSLPFWLGAHYGLAMERQHTIAEAAVLGLAYVRLTDDLRDGEVPEAAAGRTAALAEHCLAAANARLRRVMPARSPFWPWLAGLLSRWRQHHGVAGPADLQRATAADWRTLAARAAPQQVIVAALTNLAGRPAEAAEWQAVLEPLATADVLYDHVVDWPDDVTYGRYNAFVTWCLPGGAPDVTPLVRRQQAVLALGADGRGAGYFALIRRFIAQAQQYALRHGCAPLSAYLTWFEGHVAAYERAAAQETRAALTAVVRQLSDPSNLS